MVKIYPAYTLTHTNKELNDSGSDYDSTEPCQFLNELFNENLEKERIVGIDYM